MTSDTRERIRRILSRILSLNEATAAVHLSQVYEGFSKRHADLDTTLDRTFELLASSIEVPANLTCEQRRLAAAYFTCEYSIDAAALCNPSIVRAPSQEGVPSGSLRYIMSLRSIGEGHRSSVQFRSGLIDAAGNAQYDPVTKFARTATHRPPTYENAIFRSKLEELGVYTETAIKVLAELPDRFSASQLLQAISVVERGDAQDQGASQVIRAINWVASSNYECTFHGESLVCERVIFPSSPTESQGMEDARFVRFTYDDGSVTYFATYTAYDGYRILPQLIETRDFVSFRVSTLNGRAAVNKGIALFPRKIGGNFMALARLDSENNYIIRSDNVRFWHESTLLQEPQEPWEYILLGNCGSPIETPAGWLVITHGVGAFRRYCLGALLLDIDDPTKVIGRLRAPLLEPLPEERDGYVPNVVYSCGSLLHGDHLILPYGFSDVGTRIASIRLQDLIDALLAGAPN